MILLRFLDFILQDTGKLWKSCKQKCNIVKFSFEKHESYCTECRNLLLEAVSVEKVDDYGYSGGVGGRV